MKNFLKKTSEYIASQTSSDCDEFVSLIAGTDLVSENLAPPGIDQLPAACLFLNDAYGLSNSILLIEDFSRLAPYLNWTEAPKGKLTKPMDGKHTSCQIIGPDSNLHSEKVRFGVFLLAPYTHYPLHSHAAEEVYVPISGIGEWKIEQLDYVTYFPGSVIHIDPWKPHVKRSNKEPLLMLWAWVGSLNFDSYRLERGIEGNLLPFQTVCFIRCGRSEPFQSTATINPKLLLRAIKMAPKQPI